MDIFYMEDSFYLSIISVLVGLISAIIGWGIHLVGARIDRIQSTLERHLECQGVQFLGFEKRLTAVEAVIEMRKSDAFKG